MKGMTITYEVGNSLYLNITNRCSNRCDFVKTATAHTIQTLSGSNASRPRKRFLPQWMPAM